jgi:hypothetical protein
VLKNALYTDFDPMPTSEGVSKISQNYTGMLIWAFRKSTIEVDLKKSIFSYRRFSQTVALKINLVINVLKRLLLN